MKTTFIFLVFYIVGISCYSQDLEEVFATKCGVYQPVKIANEELEYEIIIIDAGFNTWLNSRAFARNYHSESFLENKNQFFVAEWNRRVLEPQRFDPMLYEMQINYDPNIHYGFEVNYLIYNYMIYFQNTYKQRLWGYVSIR